MKRQYKAHINEDTQEVQTIKEHSESTAEQCSEFAIPILKEAVSIMGLLHDSGKYQDSFQKRIDGGKLHVEHSICGALEARKKYPNALGLMMEYCIAGHHSGIPDGGSPNDTEDMPTLYGRMNRKFEDFSAYKADLTIPEIDEQKVIEFLMKDCKNREMAVNKFAFLTRYCFSCLTDADSLDTAEFCGNAAERPLKADFFACLERVNNKLGHFVCETDLQRARTLLQQQAFQRSEIDGEIYLMNMPTGSGKTLCSVKLALEWALRKDKKRIIYIIPYNSIIDQTADVFGELFEGDAEILRHQSTFSYENEENGSEDYRKAAKSAVENWDAPFIITTAVQFFESIYANKRGKLRKLHNMADAVLIFDEAHMMPQDYLQPCLQAVAYITKYLNSQAVFLTATMPDFSELISRYALPNSKIVNLIEDTSLFERFQTCSYEYLGEIGQERLAEQAAAYPSSLVIVNSRKAARALYQECRGRKYHLSTYMTPLDRKRVIDDIKAELLRLEKDFPDCTDIPEDRRITIVSTSLIEAGVDLDVHGVFRELSGLDSILQAGGRCNREGKRAEGKVYIFEFKHIQKRPAKDERSSLARGMMEKYEDISSPECIREYYRRLFDMNRESIQSHTITNQCKSLDSIPFKTYAEAFDIIDSRMVSLVVPQDEDSRKLVETLQYTGVGAVRKLQPYACSLYQRELEDLCRQHAADDFGTGIFCLTNMDYYNPEIGVTFEAKDYMVE
ncbi:CRISPR-associated helicase Cas3' [Lachnospiraceae bacterium 62-35]